MLSSIWASLEIVALDFLKKSTRYGSLSLNGRRGRGSNSEHSSLRRAKVDRAMEIARQTESHVQTGKSLAVGIAADDFPCNTKLFGEVSGLHFVVGKQLSEPFDKFLQYTHK